MTVLKLIATVLLVITSAFCGVFFTVRQIPVLSASMSPTLSSGQIVLTSSALYSLKAPKRYDVCAFSMNGRTYVKRIIGLPGETVQIKDGLVYINGKALSDDVTDMKAISPGLAADPVALGQDEYFVLGDNRNNSEDSRSVSIGKVSRDQILGKCWSKLTDLGPDRI